MDGYRDQGKGGRRVLVVGKVIECCTVEQDEDKKERNVKPGKMDRTSENPASRLTSGMLSRVAIGC